MEYGGGGGEGGGPKTLYVGNLHPEVTEHLLLALFGQIGPVKGCKIIREPGSLDPYAFIEFANNSAAAQALVTLNHRRCLEKEMKVNWATSNGHGGPAQGGAPPGGGAGGGAPGPKVDTSSHHHIFVGDLSPEITTETLRNAFTPFGSISDCRVVKDMTTQKSKGYGFVSFIDKTEAQTAIDQMNGQWLGSRSIRTNWATRKPPPPGEGSGGGGGGGFGGGGRFQNGERPDRKPFKMNYDDIFARASDTNCTVYCGGLIDTDENTIRREFNSFGRIMEIRYFKDKGYAFIRYNNKESACSAIVALHGKDVTGSGQTVKCSWGKEQVPGMDGGGGGGGYQQGGSGYPSYGQPGGEQQGYGAYGQQPMDPSQQQYMQQYAANPQYMQQVQMQQYQYAQYAAQQAQAQGYGMPHPQQ